MIERSGSGKPKNTWIQWIRIRIRNTAKSNDIERPTDLVQHSAYKGISQHRRKSAANLENLYGLAISLAYPNGEEGGYFTCSKDFYLPSRRLEEGEVIRPTIFV
jgi:hypothetical protein